MKTLERKTTKTATKAVTAKKSPARRPKIEHLSIVETVRKWYCLVPLKLPKEFAELLRSERNSKFIEIP